MTDKSTVDKVAKQRATRVAAETKKTGFREGVFFDHSVMPGRQYLVEVSFYPKTRWTVREIRTIHDPKAPLGEQYTTQIDETCSTLTAEFWAKLEPLRL